MARSDPHHVLGIEPGASQATIKAAWRRLARANHPDVVGTEPAAARSATRRMAEINRAYEQLRVGSPSRDGGPAADPGVRRRASWPPKERPTRPVTGRLDTSGTFRPRNTTTGPRSSPRGQAPVRAERVLREPPRASQPSGPLDRARDPAFRPPPLPSLAVAAALRIEFGKFHGHALGEIAAFEPSYIDWLARTISHDPELVAAARVLQLDLDARGVARRPRPTPTR